MSVSEGNEVLDRGVTISDASASKNRLLQGDTTDTTNSLEVYKLATGETTKPLAVLLEPTTEADQPSNARFSGVAVIEMNGDTIDIGDSIVATTAGKGAIATTPDAAQQWAIGMALQPSSSDGDKIKVLIDRHLITKGTA